MARAVLGGSFRGEEVYAMNPLYPYFLAGVYGVSGGGPGVVLAAQGVLDALSAVLVFAIGARFFGRGTGLLAGFAAAFYGPMIFYSGALLTPTLITFLVLAALALLVQLRDRPSLGLAGGAGVLVGLAALGRGNNALLVPGALPAFLLGAPHRGRAWLRWGAFALGAGAILGGVTLRNALVEGEFVPIAANYAAFYIGHNPKATGLYAMPDFVESARFEGEVWGARDSLSARVGKEMTLAETSRYLFREGMDYALRHPGEELRLAGTKLYYALNRTESPTNLNYAFARDFSSLLRLLPLRFGIVAALGGAGIVLSRRRWRDLVALYAVLAVTLGTCLAFFVSAEYRLPAVPVLLLFAAYALVASIAALRAAGGGKKRPGSRGRGASGGKGTRPTVPELLVAGAVLLAVGTAGNVDNARLRSQSLKRVDYLNFGILYRDRGELGRARTMLETSLRIDPRYAPAYAELAEVAHREGNDMEAARLAGLGRRFRPEGETTPEPGGAISDAILRYSELYRGGRIAEALAGFEGLRKDAEATGDPLLLRGLLNNIGLCRYKLRDLDGAGAIFLEILAADSTYVKAQNNLGLVRAAEGRKDEARARFLRSLALEPGNPTAIRELRRLDGGP